MKTSEVVQQKSKDVQVIIEQILDVMQECPGIAAVYLLGSALTGRMHVDSDIDIALLPMDKVKVSLQSRLEVAALLEEKLGRIVDIGIITPGNLIYASEAIFNGRRIITLNEDYTNTSETSLLGCYSVFKQDRKEIEESYRAA